jgi:Zn-dependent protease with chaperone function
VNEDRSARYHKLGRRSELASLAWGTGFLLAALAPPVSWLLRGAAEALAGPAPAWVRPTATVLAYVVSLGLAHQVGALPIAFYRSFILEHRYGLSTERLRHWALDRVKGAAVGAPLALAASACVYLAIWHWPVWWWAAVAAGYAVVVVVMTGLAPVVLLPIFFTFRPLERQELRDRLIALSRRAGVAVSDACEWRVSDRTKKANAALTGLGRTRRILVSDTLLGRYSDDEVEGILAHELGHQVHHDIWRGIALHNFVTALGLLAASRALDALASPLGWTGVGDVSGLPVLLLTAGVVSLALRPLVNASSRRMEREADRFSIELTGNPAAFATAIERLGVQNLTEERPSRLARWFFYTHPPVAERVAAARRRLDTAR